MDKIERRSAEVIRDRLKKILPDLKLAYENAKDLSENHDWDINYFDMCEAYMNLANAYIDVLQTLEEEDGGGAE